MTIEKTERFTEEDTLAAVARAIDEQPDEDEGYGEELDQLSQDALALALGAQWPDARYVDAWKAWYFFEDGFWKKDDTKKRFTRTRQFMRQVAARVEKATKVEKLLSASNIAKVASLAESNPGQVATVDQWDADRYLLGAHGEVDLRTGKLGPARPESYLTRQAAVAPAEPGAKCPRWTRFLEEITGGDRELQEYLQRMAGYCLTGDVAEHMLAFLYGTGANGKSVFLSTLTHLWGNYAATFPTEMLMASNSDRHPTEIARLRGIRLAVGSEIEVGRKWAESKIKAMTGGDRQVGRFMRRDFFEFDPQFKILVAGNAKPTLRQVDEATRRRFHLIPFEVTIPPNQRDPDLTRKLKAEGPAILRWAIDGCLRWQAEGLAAPASVRAATDEYLFEEDPVARWMEDCTVEEPGWFEPNASLYRSFTEWARRSGEDPSTQIAFGKELNSRGFEKARTDTARGFKGLKLKDGSDRSGMEYEREDQNDPLWSSP